MQKFKPSTMSVAHDSFDEPYAVVWF